MLTKNLGHRVPKICSDHATDIGPAIRPVSTAHWSIRD